MIYSKGDIFESISDLTRLNGPDAKTVKFEKMHDGVETQGGRPVGTPAEQHQVDVDTDVEDLKVMTIKELRDIAAEEEIDLEGANTKAEIIELIQQAK
jgi:hypothetical protein